MEEFDVKASDPIHVNNIFGGDFGFQENESHDNLSSDLIEEHDTKKNSANNIMNFDDQD